MRRVQGESGQVGTWLVLLVACCLTGFGSLYVARLAKGAGQASQVQTAADAAALAGAQGVVRETPLRLPEAFMTGGRLAGGTGEMSATDFASRNGSTLVSYRYDPVTDRVSVRVRTRETTETGRQEEASASARVGIRLGPCITPPAMVPLEPIKTTCGELRVTATFPAGIGPPVVVVDPPPLKERVKVRLIG